MAGRERGLKLYDIETKQTKTLTKDHLVARPAISGDMSSGGLAKRRAECLRVR